jgi:predicted ester cyclase
VAGRVGAIDELVAPDFVSHTWGFTEDGRNKLRAATEHVHGSLKDVAFTIDEMVAENDLVVARLTSSATPIGEFMGVPARGKRYTIGEMHMFRIRDGQVSEHWLQHDALGLMRQLGALPNRG